MHQTYCIAVDAMGGDFGPRITVEASLEALNSHPDLEILLVGDLSILTQSLSGRTHPRLHLIHAENVIASDARVISALREGSASSMQIALDQVDAGRAGACVSAGNTGALMALARRTLGTLEGIDRPAITAAVPTLKGQCQVLDLGANLDASPEMLKQFAILGRALVRVEQGVEPTIGLLNVGSEESKGSEELREASQQIASLPGVDFVGFVEGADLYAGKADLIVCDGFTGNVALKSGEGLARFMRFKVRQVFASSIYGRVVAFLARPILNTIAQELDAGSRNGALLLGLNALVVKSHGAAKASDFTAAIERALIALRLDLTAQIKDQLDN